MHYQILHSVSETHLRLLCRDGEFEHIRHQGPWQTMHRGQIINLRRSYPLRLARYGFVIENSKLAVFYPEA